MHNSYSGFERWLQREADIPAERAEVVTAIGLGALLSSRLMPTLFGVAVTRVTNETLVQTWADMMQDAISEDTPRCRYARPSRADMSASRSRASPRSPTPPPPV